MRVQCPNCGGPHPKWDCKSPSKKSLPHAAGSETNAKGGAVASRPDSQRGEAGGNPAQLNVAAGKKSTAARKDVREPKGSPSKTKQVGSAPAGTQAPPVDAYRGEAQKVERRSPKPEDAGSIPATSAKRGRKPISDPTPRQLYQRELMRQRRARLKAQKEAK